MFKCQYTFSNFDVHVRMSEYSSKCQDFVKTSLLGVRLATGASRLHASAVSKKVEGLPSWSVQLDSPGTALTVGGWIRPGGQN